MDQQSNNNGKGCSSGCACRTQHTRGMARRDFLRIAGAGAATLSTAGPWQVLAGPFEGKDLHLIPADKKLSSSWIRSLYERGQEQTYTDEELKYIGMPVGGICCGQLYLGGDGRLWLWDIFKSQYHREPDHGQRLEAMTLCGHYTKPPTPENAVTRDNGAHVEQGFVLRIKQAGHTATRFLDRRGFDTKYISFRGEYPIGRVTYSEPDLPIQARLEAFSPFIPLRAKDSAIPATVLSWKLTNTSEQPAQVQLLGYLENAVCPYDRQPSLGQRYTLIERHGHMTVLLHKVRATAKNKSPAHREDLPLTDFETDRYPEGWQVTGNAFGEGPFALKDQHHGQNISNAQGKKVVNTYNPILSQGDDPNRLTGTLTSPVFKIQRDHLSFLLSGGSDKERTCLNLLIDDNVVTSATGHRDNLMRRVTFDVKKYQGKQARIQIVDAHVGHWGVITVDDLRQTDTPVWDERKLEELHGYGSLALALLDETELVYANPKVGSAPVYVPDKMFQSVNLEQAISAFDERPIGSLGTTVTLAPGQTRTVRFVLGWYFPDYHQKDYGGMLRIQDFDRLRRQYAPRFTSADDVVCTIAEHWDELAETTLTWNRTWYDSTLPYWLLDRSFISLDCLASQTCHWFDNGRFWGWEGVDCCEGTCTHVWQYAQGLARIFPEIERDIRRRVDFGLSFNEDSGVIAHRGEIHRTPAVDGQAGTILRALREHRMSKDSTFLYAVWPKIKKAFAYLEGLDTNGDSLLDANQPHTLDAAWAGEIAWISSLYLAAAQTCVEMAEEMNDTAFARYCEKIVIRGRKQLVSQLFNGEYFIHKPDPKKPKMLNTNDGCHIDQVLGQSFAHQVGLSERIVPKSQTLSALRSLWTYNFAPDAGGYALKQRDIGRTFRWYAMPGEAGLLMCTWPKGGADKAVPGVPRRSKENPTVWTGPGGYFNECMNGFEYQAASHMIYEGEPDSDLVEKGLVVVRAVHDRYHADARNPYNEIECSDHYARSMASYGVFLALCGFEYHGPKGHIGFAPRLKPENFKAAFTGAEGWGTFTQHRQANTQYETIAVKWGRLTLRSLAFTIPKNLTVNQVKISAAGKVLPCRYNVTNRRLSIELEAATTLEAGQTMAIAIRY